MTSFALSAAAAAAVLDQDVADCGLNERAADWLQSVGHDPDALPEAVGFAPDVGRCPITGLRHVPGLVIRITLTEVGELRRALRLALSAYSHLNEEGLLFADDGSGDKINIRTARRLAWGRSHD